eukprot:scaffold18969_cov205-Skeletonema_dohrnii-CCMP3373.AAC.2
MPRTPPSGCDAGFVGKNLETTVVLIPMYVQEGLGTWEGELLNAKRPASLESFYDRRDTILSIA